MNHAKKWAAFGAKFPFIHKVFLDVHVSFLTNSQLATLTGSQPGSRYLTETASPPPNRLTIFPTPHSLSAS